MRYLDSMEQVVHLLKLMLSIAFSITLMCRLKTSTTVTLMEEDYPQFEQVFYYYICSVLIN